MEIIRRITVIDFFFIFLGLKIVHSAISQGLGREILKLAGLVATAGLTFYLYLPLSSKLATIFPVLQDEWRMFVSSLIVFLGAYINISLLTRILAFVCCKEGQPIIFVRWICLALGICRFLFLTSVIVFIATLCPVRKGWLHNSIISQLLGTAAPRICSLAGEGCKKIKVLFREQKNEKKDKL